MKKIIILIFSNILYGGNFVDKKTCLVPLSDSYPLRYFYHTPFYYDRFNSGSQWLCKGNCMVRYQQLVNKNILTDMLFENPMIVASNGNLSLGAETISVYNGTVLGLGFSDMISKSDIKLNRNSIFIDCTVEIARLNCPYYLHIGIPIQRTDHKVDWEELIYNNNEVVKGGFMQEYKASSPVPSLLEWESTPSTIIRPLTGIKQYLNGAGIGSLLGTDLGKLPPSSMTLWAMADLYMQFGYDGFACQKITGGYYGRVIIPTSPSLHSAWNKYIFYPTIGNVGRWEFDLGLNGTCTVFNTDLTRLMIYSDGYVGYMERACHMRPFDLVNGFFTRYSPVKMFDGNSLLSKNMSIRAIDLTTQTYQIGSCVKAEFILDIEYQFCQSYFNAGYSFKLQGKEKANTQERKVNPGWSLQQNSTLYGFSSQQVLQTPNPIMGEDNWATNLITPHSNMKMVSVLDVSPYRGTGEMLVGVPFDDMNQMTKNSIDINSGLMNGQFLNMFIGGYTYKIIGRQYDTIFGIKGSYAKSPMKYYTPSFYEFGLFLELDY